MRKFGMCVCALLLGWGCKAAGADPVYEQKGDEWFERSASVNESTPSETRYAESAGYAAYAKSQEVRPTGPGEQGAVFTSAFTKIHRRYGWSYEAPGYGTQLSGLKVTYSYGGSLACNGTDDPNAKAFANTGFSASPYPNVGIPNYSVEKNDTKNFSSPGDLFGGTAVGSNGGDYGFNPNDTVITVHVGVSANASATFFDGIAASATSGMNNIQAGSIVFPAPREGPPPPPRRPPPGYVA